MLEESPGISEESRGVNQSKSRMELERNQCADDMEARGSHED